MTGATPFLDAQDADLRAAKGAARKAAFARRKAAFDAGLAPAAAAALWRALAPHRGRALAGYMPIRTEADPLPVMTRWAHHAPGARVGVPVILAAHQPLEFHLWHPEAEMRAGTFGAATPADARIMRPEVVIVPLVAFDAAGNRLGYGGGFYDRTLELLRADAPGSITAIGFAFEAQLSDTALPQEPTDQPLDMIVTETCVRRF
ncbi:5-formyltetrahydrofolate cyclo-ligase [Brevirhabdus sp.]|uniref:5-formyltetrahydrofolate cyclo-ligase n=1 Tax=Brevirhabdus sp. TaxID=2004514 RepID=UPI00405A0AD6